MIQFQLVENAFDFLSTLMPSIIEMLSIIDISP